MRLLILGTGSMAHNYAAQFGAIKDVSLAAAVDIDAVRLQSFCQRYAIPRSFTSLSAAIEWGDFDAVANATADSLHYLTTLEALDALAMVQAAYKNDSNGVLGHVGIHIVDLVTYVINTDINTVSCRLKTFEKAPDNRIGNYELDANDSFVMTVDFMNGALGVIHASRWATGHINELKLRAYGDKGGLELRHRHEGTSLKICTGEDAENGIWRPIDTPPVHSTYQLFIDAVRQGKTLEPSFSQAAKIQRILDRVLNST